MNRLFIFICTLLTGCSLAHGQHVDLEFKLVDDATAAPISDAHVFISNSSVGTISNEQGICKLKVPIQESQTLIISHISYETLEIESKRYTSLVGGATVKMKSNGLDINDIVITAKPTNKWKRNFKKFRQALLGEDIPVSQCKILNPEVLRFEDQEGKFIANAIDHLQIDNEYLGYKIHFWLDELTIDVDGSKYYKGNVQFMDQLDIVDDPKKRKRRERIYVNSLAHFLRSLVSSADQKDLLKHGYQVSIENYRQGEFQTVASPEPQSLIEADSKPGYYQLHFPEFLAIQHSNIDEKASSDFQVAVSKAEQRRFGTSSSMAVGKGKQYLMSKLYKIEPYLLFDIRGNIINKAAVKEYGFWASQHLASALPVDYKKFSELDLNIPEANGIDTLSIFQDLVGVDDVRRLESLDFIRDTWSTQYIAPLLDILRLSKEGWHQREIQGLLNDKVPEMEPTYFDGSQWLWKNAPDLGDYYADFKGHLYGALDTSFTSYFINRGSQSEIRLDEIVWGGVSRDGIPPLRSPKMINASEAKYLSEKDIVFGIVINGEAYAYPKRILAWHEFFTDEISGNPIAGVYCTLCGTVIVYNAEVDGVRHALGTSGFLYRSNKLMYDEATHSLWSTILGRPVVGPLINQNIELEVLPVETTDWGEWMAKYPRSKVLSLNTGYERNYDEGEAYKEYFATDALMFPVPEKDSRLSNKARVFIPRTAKYAGSPLAVSIDYLKRKRIYQDQLGDQNILIITESNIASRAYAIGDQVFKSYKQRKLLDEGKQQWQVTDDYLIGPDGTQLARLPSHEAFWFGWVNAYPNTRLVK